MSAITGQERRKAPHFVEGQRYCIGKDRGSGGRVLWRVYDDVEKRFAEPQSAATNKAWARIRAAALNVAVTSDAD